MTFALNTSHALYANLKMFIGVDESNQLVDLVTPSRTFTKHASAVYGTGGLGRHAGVRRSGYSPFGWAFDTAFSAANNTGTLIIVLNAVRYIEWSSGKIGTFIGTNSGSPSSFGLPNIGGAENEGVAGVVYDSGSGDTSKSAQTATSGYTSTPLMLTLVRNGTTAYALHVNGETTPQASGTALGTNQGGNYSYIGGIDTVIPMDYDLVYAVYTSDLLTPTNISDLYATLGASNAFGLLAGAPAATATTLSGPSSGTVGVASSNFTVGFNGAPTGTVLVTPSDGGAGGTFTPTTVSISSGTPTGTFTYTPASTGAKTIGTANNGSLSNPTALIYTSNAAGDTTAPILTSPTGTSTGSTTASGTVTTDEANGTLYALASTNATETAATVKGSANTQAITTAGSKSVSFTGLTASTTYYAHYCHRDAAGNDSTVANSASFTTDAAAVGTLTLRLANNTATVQPGVTGIVAHVLLGSTGAVVVSKTGQATDASADIAVSDALIAPGTDYFLAYVNPTTGAAAITNKVTAT